MHLTRPVGTLNRMELIRDVNRDRVRRSAASIRDKPLEIQFFSAFNPTTSFLNRGWMAIRFWKPGGAWPGATTGSEGKTGAILLRFRRKGALSQAIRVIASGEEQRKPPDVGMG